MAFGEYNDLRNRAQDEEDVHENSYPAEKTAAVVVVEDVFDCDDRISRQEMHQANSFVERALFSKWMILQQQTR